MMSLLRQFFSQTMHWTVNCAHMAYGQVS
jgi:hypothetical protein